MAKHYPDFNDFINGLTQEGYNAVMKNIEKFGDPKEIMVSLLNTQPLVNTKTREVRLNDRFFLWHQKKTFWNKQNAYLHLLEQITDCYHSWNVSNGEGVVGIVKATGNIDYSGLLLSESTTIYRLLEKHVRGVNSIVGQAPVDDSDVVEFEPDCYGMRYCLKGNTLVRQKGKDYSKEYVVIENIQELVWCQQVHGYDSENDVYDLRVYFPKKKKWLDISCDSVFQSYRMAMEFKKRVPHLLYGPSEEYTQIYKRNPEELLALAKSRLCR